MDLGSFFGSKNLFTCPLDVSYSEGERSERASAASDVSGAMELFWSIFGGIFAAFLMDLGLNFE